MTLPEAVHRLSVIIPAYNAGGTLKNTLKSVLSQTIRDIEVWVVDDGSTDDTAVIADEMALTDGRVRVLHQKNNGAYAARLSALKHVKSKWVSFVDADDTIDPHLYSKVIEFAERNNLDIVQYDEPDTVDSARPYELFTDRKDIVDNIIRPRLFAGNGAMLVWDKLYRNEYDYDEFPAYDGVTQFDDHILNLVFFKRAKRVGYLHIKMYDYKPNVGTASKRYGKRSLHGLLSALEARERYLPQYGISLEDRDCLLWREKNFFNIYVRAAFSRPCTISEACGNLREIAETEAFKQCIGHPVGRHGRLLVILSIISPVWVVLAARFAHTIRSLVKAVLK